MRLTFDDAVEGVDAVVVGSEPEVEQLPLDGHIGEEDAEQEAEGVHEERQGGVGGQRGVGDVGEDLDEAEDDVEEGGHAEQQQQDHEGRHVGLEEERPAVAVDGPGERGHEQHEHDVADGGPLGGDGHVGDGGEARVAREAERGDDDDEQAGVVEAEGVVEEVVGSPVGELVRAGEELQVLGAVDLLLGHVHEHEGHDEGDRERREEVELRRERSLHWLRSGLNDFYIGLDMSSCSCSLCTGVCRCIFIFRFIPVHS